MTPTYVAVVPCDPDDETAIATAVDEWHMQVDRAGHTPLAEPDVTITTDRFTGWTVARAEGPIRTRTD